MAWQVLASGQYPATVVTAIPALSALTPGSLVGPFVFSDQDANDSDKTLVFDTDVAPFCRAPMIVRAVYADLTVTATAGTRFIALDWLDPSDTVMFRYLSVGNITAGAGNRERFSFAEGVAGGYAAGDLVTAGTFTINYERLPARMPFGPGMKLRVFDVSASDPTADDMLVWIWLDKVGT